MPAPESLDAQHRAAGVEARPHADLTAGGRVLDGVVDEIGGDLLEPDAVAGGHRVRHRSAFELTTPLQSATSL